MFGLGVIGLAIYMYTLYDVFTSKFSAGHYKAIWILIVIFLPLVGTLLWFLIGKIPANRRRR